MNVVKRIAYRNFYTSGCRVPGIYNRVLPFVVCLSSALLWSGLVGATNVTDQSVAVVGKVIEGDLPSSTEINIPNEGMAVAFTSTDAESPILTLSHGWASESDSALFANLLLPVSEDSQLSKIGASKYVSAFGLNPLGSGEGQIVHSTSNKALERTEVGIWLWHFNFKKALSAFLPSPGFGEPIHSLEALMQDFDKTLEPGWDDRVKVTLLRHDENDSGLDDGRYAHQLWLHGLLPSDLAGKHAALEDWGNGVARIQGMRGWRNNEELARSPMNSMSPSIIALTASSVNKQKAKEARYWVNPKSCPARPGMRRAKISAP